MKNLLTNNNKITNGDKNWTTVINKRSHIKRDTNNKFKIMKEDDNMKKMLCNNILTLGICHYGNKCMYAHNLEEQNVDQIRSQAYDIITGKEKIKFRPNKELSRNLLQLTKVCEECIKKKCPGGYNCKYGVFDKKYQICADDLRYGICYNVTCNNIHLTNKGLIPLSSNGKNEIIRIKYTDNNTNPKDITIPDGTLLSDNFFIHLDKNNKYKNDSEDSDDESTQRIKAYLEQNSDSDKSCDESIFS